MKPFNLLKTAPAALMALGLVGSQAACDFETTGQQLQSSRVMVATVLATPAIELQPVALVGADGGFDAGMLDLDAGVGFDADGGTVTLPPQTLGSIFFGERDPQSLDAPPTPLTGGQASLTIGDAAPVALPEKGDGRYEQTSGDDEALAYQTGASYVFRVTHRGQTYVGRVDGAPQLEEIPAFHPPKGYIEHTAGQSFTFERPAPPQGGERNLGFVNVFPLSDDGERGGPTWSNIPTKPKDFLDLISNPGKFRETQVTVPGSAFPESGKTYLLVMQAVKAGRAESANLFAGSALLAGTAEVAVFRTR